MQKKRKEGETRNEQTSKPLWLYTHTHTHTYILTKEELAKIAKVCLSYSKIGHKGYEKVCKLNCNIQYNIQNETCKNNNNSKIKDNYKYTKIGVV